MTVRSSSSIKGRSILLTAGRVLLVLGLLLSGVISVAAAAPASTSLGMAPGAQRLPAPHLLLQNVGQYAPDARFLLTQGGERVWLADGALWLMVPDPAAPGEQTSPAAPTAGRLARLHRQRTTRPLSGTAIRFTFPGANPAAALEPYGAAPAHVSYLLGNDPAAWQRDVPAWTAVRYRDLYPGIDLVIGADATGSIPWRFEARDGADLNAVALRAEGADLVTADAGQLRLQIGSRTLDVALPAWSLTGQDQPAPSVLVGQVGADMFAVAPGSSSATPATEASVAALADLIYNASLGGSAYDAGSGIAVDYLGNAYVSGETESATFPGTAGHYDSSPNGGTDAFVAKYNAAGNALIYATYLGGSLSDYGWGIAVDGALAYVVGDTASPDFPVIGGAVGGSDIFVAALNADGTNVRYVSRLGGNGIDYGYGIAIAGLNAYVVGQTYSTDLPGNCAGQASTDLVVAKFGAVGAPLYTTCLGGSDIDVGYGIAVHNGDAYVTGESFSTDFPGGAQAGSGDILVAKFDASGTRTASTLVGGTAEDTGAGIAVDGNGNVYVAATTASIDDFPVTANTAAAGGGLNDGIVLKLLPAFTVNFATFLGGNDEDYAYGIAVDTIQALYVAGATLSNNFPATAGAYNTTANGNFDAFVARLHLGSSAANKVTYATYLGAARDDWGNGAATDTGGNAFVTGSSASSNNPASTNAFVAKLKVSSPPAAPVVSIAAGGSDAVLSWPAVTGASTYQVFLSDRPYFKPGDWSSVLPVAESSALSYPDSGALTQANAHFYVVKAVSSAPEVGASSNRVGKFSFQLTPGN